MIVAITGVSGYLGQLLSDRLAADDTVDAIVGIDIVEPHTSPDKLRFHRVDVRDPDLTDLLKGVSALVHLAAVFDPIHDEVLMSDINVNGTLNVLSCATDAAVEQIVYPSSTAVYGAHPDNDYPLTEESRLRANIDFCYARQVLEVERRLSMWKEDHPEQRITILRMANVLGSRAKNHLSRSYETPRIITISGYSPPVQLLHEDDAVDAICFALANCLDGTYNVAGRGELSRAELLRIARKKELRIPEALAFPAAKVAWKLGISEIPPGELHLRMHRVVASTGRLEDAGYVPERTSAEALSESVESSEGWVTLGTARIASRKYQMALRILIGLLLVLVTFRFVRSSGRADSL